MFGYCLNNPAICVDSSGDRAYFINGIHNENDESAPGYAYRFADELSAVSGETVVVIPVYYGQSKWYHYITGVVQVAFEMMNINVYTTDIVDFIMSDLENNPLEEGEQITIIGYSGGGQLALNAMETLDIPVDNVVLIGAPVMEVWNTETNVSMIYSNHDPLSWNIGYGPACYNVGNVGHTQYFDPANIQRISQLVTAIIK